MAKKNLMLSLLSGLMLGLSFPPFHLGFLAWIFLIPLFQIFNQSIKLSEKIKFFYLAGFTSHAIITHWVALNSGTSMQVAIISYLALCIFYSFYWVLFCFILHFFDKRIEEIKILEGKELNPVITDDFIMIPNPRTCDSGKEYKVVFNAQTKS